MRRFRERITRFQPRSKGMKTLMDNLTKPLKSFRAWKPGYTMLELVIALTILSFLVVVIGTVISNYFRMLNLVTVDRENMNEARLAMEAITDLITARQRPPVYASLSTIPPDNGIYEDPDGSDGPQALIRTDGTVPSETSVKLWIQATPIGQRYGELRNADGIVYARGVKIEFFPVAGSSVRVKLQSEAEYMLDDCQLIGIRVFANTHPEMPQTEYTLTTYVYAM